MSTAPAKGSSERLVSPFRLMLWLKMQLMGRNLTRKKTVVGIIFSVIFSLIFVGISIFCGVELYHYLVEAPTLIPVVNKACLSLLFLFWIIAPLLGFAVNDTYDPTRLFVYPVRYQTIFAANVVGRLFEISTILALPIVVALAVLSSSGIVAAVLSALLIVVFLLQTIALSQAIILTMLGFLQSRRFRDVTVVLLPLIGLTYYLFQQLFVRGIISSLNWSTILTSPAWNYLLILPSGWIAAGLTSARDGAYLPSVLWLLITSGTTTITILYAAWIMQQLYFGDRGTSVSSSTAQVSNRTDRVARAPVIDRGASQASLILAFAQKEWIYFQRDPMYKALAVSVLYTFAVVGASLLGVGRQHAASAIPSAGGAVSGLKILLPCGIVTLLLLGFSSIIFNIFGGEGRAITLLFSFPTARRSLIMGKNLAHAPVIFGVSLLAIAGAGTVLHSPGAALIGFAWLLMALPVVIGAGNLLSVLFPRILAVRGARLAARAQQGSTGSVNPAAGCGYALLGLAGYAATMITLLPALGLIALPAYDIIPRIWFLLTVPIGIAYAAGVYAIALHLSLQLIASREDMIIARVAPPAT